MTKPERAWDHVALACVPPPKPQRRGEGGGGFIGIFGFAVLAIFQIGFSVFVAKDFGFSVLVPDVVFVSAKTVNSVQFMEWGLGRLADILGEYDYKALDLLSCMTLDVENCHATVHSKKVNMSKLEYATVLVTNR